MSRKILFIWTMLTLLHGWAMASHIVGGNLGYTYLGIGPNNTFRYKISLITYTDCSPTSEIPIPAASVVIGIYAHSMAAPNAAKLLKQTLTTPLVFSEIITPPLPPGCSIGQASCIYKGLYEVEVLLESTMDGYHVYYERCCRNTALVNILNPSQTSTGFYTFIPPTSIPNSSPVFLDDPVPMICVGDSLFLPNTAIDPDGDFLLYSFTTPYAGFADILNPAPLPEPILQWPVTPVIFQTNFSTGQPFGPGGYSSIHALTGMSVYKSSLIGSFAVAVQVSEYRNNMLISTTRRDMQFISLVCPQNMPPTGNFPQGLEIQITEGDTLCFDFSYEDPEADSIFLETGGEPFLMANPATFTEEYTGASSLRGEICWAPPCGSARPTPYLIYYKAADNGCPPKERVSIMSVTVLPDTATMTISGDTAACGLQSSLYTTSKTSGVFQWTVTNGNIVPPSDGPSANVLWALPPSQLGTVTVIRNGPCRNDTASLTVHINPKPFVDAGNDTSACMGMLIPLHGNGTGNIHWDAPGATLNNPGILNPSFSAPAGSYLPILTITSAAGCVASDTVLVQIFPLPELSITGRTEICQGDTTILTANGASTYLWTSNANILSPSMPSTAVYMANSSWIYVTGKDTNQCISKDSILVNVFGANLSTSSDTLLCLGESITLTFLPTSSAQVYWTPTDYLQPSWGETVTSSPLTDITYGVHAINADGCTDSAYISLSVKPLPQVSAESQTKLFCDYVEVILSSTNTSDSLYWLLAHSYAVSGSPATVHINPQQPETISLVAVTEYGCRDTLAVHPTFGTLEELLPTEFPNIITPNNDLINDVWNPALPDGFNQCVRLSIFNRWGNMVFDSKTFPIVWNGKNPSGYPLSDGVYFYVLEIGGMYKKGTVTIAR
jgi:gliding motility-associated-like protein